jgi:hypothetical protein
MTHAGQHRHPRAASKCRLHVATNFIVWSRLFAYGWRLLFYYFFEVITPPTTKIGITGTRYSFSRQDVTLGRRPSQYEEHVKNLVLSGRKNLEMYCPQRSDKRLLVKRHLESESDDVMVYSDAQTARIRCILMRWWPVEILQTATCVAATARWRDREIERCNTLNSINRTETNQHPFFPLNLLVSKTIVC